MVVTWTAPYDGGSQITSFTIKFKHTDGFSLSEELAYCDGSDLTIMANL